jgi:hypothetical protein
MANAAVASWTTCIKKLQQLVKDPLTDPESTKALVDKLGLLQNAPLPNTAWKKLVHDVQVLQR